MIRIRTLKKIIHQAVDSGFKDALTSEARPAPAKPAPRKDDKTPVPGPLDLAGETS